MQTGERVRWIDGHVVCGPTTAPLRVLMLHYAGGSAASMLPIARRLPDRVETISLELDGRGERSARNPPETFDHAVRQLLPAFQRWIDRTTVVVGHSMGALLAHAAVTALPAGQAALVCDLILSGSRSPTTTSAVATHPAAPFLNRSAPDLAAELRTYGGCPPELFSDNEMLALAVSRLGQDLHLVDTYRDPGVPATTAATNHIWVGRDDPWLTDEEPARWAASTPSTPNIRSFDGGHFFLTQEREPARVLGDLVDSRLEDET